MNSAVEEIHAAVDRLRRSARAEGIEVEGPLGQWLEAQAQALLGLAALFEGQDDRVGELLARIDTTANAELHNLREALEAANHVLRQGEFALRQARQVQTGVVVEREHMVTEMIKVTLPMFADRLKGALVIREQGWNAEARDRRFAIAGAIATFLFLVGYAVCWWQDSSKITAMNRCMAQPVQIEGQLYCPAGSLFGPAKMVGGPGGS